MTDEIIAFLHERYAEDEQWARAASQRYPYVDDNAPPVPEGGAHWRWVAGDDWHTVDPNPAVDEFVGGDEWSVRLATVEEWQTARLGHNPNEPIRMMPQTYMGTCEEMDASAAGHIARWDPARVLADVESKRKILDEIEAHISSEPSDPADLAAEDWIAGFRSVLTGVLLAMVRPYEQHPAFRAEWKVER